jgi:NADP-dependent 3-hydroxy acid dehydrogenase YdfG
VSALAGTIALVTGASSGIGEATARALAVEGATVALVARRADRLKALAAELDGSSVLAVDLTQREQALAAVERVATEYGRIDVVVNSAGVMLNGPIVDAPLDEWERMVEINVRGLLFVCHAAVPHLLRAAEQEPRHVADLVNVSSIAGRFANRGAGVYNATKFGVNAFSESLRQEVTKRHVRCASSSRVRSRRSCSVTSGRRSRTTTTASSRASRNSWPTTSLAGSCTR